jgi:hypothetical protein
MIEGQTMTRTFRRAAALVVAATAAVLFAVPAPRPASAEPAKLPAGLKLVPADAAVFVHVDVAALWNSKVGATLRKTKIPQLDKSLQELKEKTGLTPDMVKTVTVFFPQFKQPGDQSTVVVHVTFSKPYDKPKLLAAVKKQNAGSGTVKETEPGVYDFFLKKQSEPEATIVLTDPKAITIASTRARKYLKPPPATTGPQTEAIQAAASGATAVLGVNFANLPDELRSTELPAEARPFQPLLRSDALLATARLNGDELKLNVRFRNQTRAKTADAEKSLAALNLLGQTALAFAVQQLEKAKNENEKKLLPLVQETLAVLKTIRISTDGNEAIAAATVKTDLPYGPLLQELFGGSPRAAAARATTQNNLKQIGLAMHNYHDTYNGFPPASLVDKKGRPMLSWRVMILPYIEQQALYMQFHLDEPWDSDHNKKLLEKYAMPTVYALPGVTKPGEKTTHFQVFVGNGALFDRIQGFKIQSISDGTSNTVMVATAAKAVPWTKPDDIPFDPKTDPRTQLLFQNDATSLGFADGSVRTVRKTIAADTLKALITKGGGEVVSPSNLP